jgi:small subunit ribosomal protein S1
MATSKTSNPIHSTGATSMAELMASHKSNLKSYKKGEIAQGVITKLTSGEILVDIGSKTEAVVMEKDKGILRTLLSTLKVGDTVSVSILNTESDQGNPVVSLRRFMDEKLWGKLEKLKDDKVVMDVNVNDLTKGGFLVSTSTGVSGFLPNSQAVLSDSPQSFVGKKIQAVVLEINRPLHKIIFSQKAAVGDEDFLKSTSEIKPGTKVEAIVGSTTSFGVFVSLKNTKENLEGFIHLSELSWDRTESAESFYKVGEVIEAQVIGVDKDAKRVNLSIKRLTLDPFEEASKEFNIDSKVKGTIKQINSQGLIIDLGNIEGLVKKDKLPPNSKYTTGDQIELTVSEIDAKRHRVVLTPVLKEKPMGYR